MPTKKRLTALALAGGISGLFFIPFALVSQPSVHPIYLWIGFPLGSLAATWLFGWAGLKIADRAGLPMPFLRPWELGEKGDQAERGWLIRVCVAAGGIFGLGITVTAHLLRMPANPGTLAVRLATFPFAAVVTEVIAHLFVMSGLMLLVKRTWISILLSAVVFIFVIHFAQAGTMPETVIGWVADYLFGVLTGWIYSRYGIEGATLTHAVAHTILMGMN